MSYTVLLLVVVAVVPGTTSCRGAEPAYPVVGLTTKDQVLGIADRARGEVLWRIRREAARRVKLSDRTRGATPNTAASRSCLSGPAAAHDKYEHAPHDVTTVRRVRALRTWIGRGVHDVRFRYRDERLGA
jgi:hypothetical protein